MDQQPLPPAPSLGATMLNVFTSPSEVFTGMHQTESKISLWVLPLIITILMVILVIMVSATNENLKSQRIDATRIVLDQKVADGKMSQAEMDRTMQAVEGGSRIILIIQAIAVAIVVSLVFFLSALVLWVGSKLILKSPAGYEKILELNGIASWIGILGVIFQILMMIGLNSIYAQPNLAIFFYSTFNPLNSMHKFLSLINFFAIWQTIVVGLGLAKWSTKGILLAMTISFVVWFLILGLMTLVGFGG